MCIRDRRRIAYNYEMQMCRTGKIDGVNYQDSLFRGIEVDGDSVDSDKIQFERALINLQISNLLKQAGVDTSSITKDYTFTVDPYSYEITVDGVDEMCIRDRNMWMKGVSQSMFEASV